MDAWDDNYTEPTDDDLAARRVISLALVLSNANRPLLTSEIRQEVYYNFDTPVFRKTFQRDRERLALAGYVLRTGPKVDRETTWLIDDSSTFANVSSLSQEEALTLDFLLIPLASDPSYPYARDLQMALAKIDRSFDGSSTAMLEPRARIRNNTLAKIEQAMVAHHVIQVHYVRANATSTDRLLAPYGLFSYNGVPYLVAANMDDDTTRGEAPHTYNVDRMSKVREPSRSTYEPPVDFDVRDYLILPFQAGQILYEAEFKASGNPVELHAKYASNGTWIERDGTTILLTTVSDEGIAASWALAEEFVPLSPQSLVSTYYNQLKRMASVNEDA